LLALPIPNAGQVMLPQMGAQHSLLLFWVDSEREERSPTKRLTVKRLESSIENAFREIEIRVKHIVTRFRASPQLLHKLRRLYAQWSHVLIHPFAVGLLRREMLRMSSIGATNPHELLWGQRPACNLTPCPPKS
jgi:hypothetical protein